MLIVTTRDSGKGNATKARLKRHLSKHPRTRSYLPLDLPRVIFRLENLELTSLVSVKQLSQRLLCSAIPRLDAIILNASVLGVVGLNWPLTFWTIATDLIQSLTWPTYKIGARGLLTGQQTYSSQTSHRIDGANADGEQEESVLGQVFCANVFGHYMLTHWLMPLLRACPESAPARIVWVSSLVGDASAFKKDDFQGLESTHAYEHTKRITDLMALTATGQPTTAQHVANFVAVEDGKRGSPLEYNSTTSSSQSPATFPLHRRSCPSTPSIHVIQPGVCATSIFSVPFIVQTLMTFAFYIARWLGSPWFNVNPYFGATAPVWLALGLDQPADHDDSAVAGDSAAKQRDNQHSDIRSIKWGSAIDRWGQESVKPTDTPGWGTRGDGQPVKWWHTGSDWLSGGRGRKRLGRIAQSKSTDRAKSAAEGKNNQQLKEVEIRDPRDPTLEEVHAFIQEGAFVWSQLEALRKEWQGRIERYVAAAKDL